VKKAEFINKLARELNVTAKEAGRYLEAVLKGITQGLAEEGKVNFVGFGSFTVKKVAARKVRNPQTGKEMTVPEKSRPTFKAGTALKDAVN
jgi:DNA-binding protein HU-beta